ncbi:MAG: hypothetical protein MMC33_002941 [Icmadophila ericetorum]|nr:hypothetical protein [Icmadophila ericetorum]
MNVVAKPRRKQVTRACDWCRLNRIAKVEEVGVATATLKTLERCPQQIEPSREIERLKARLKDLESELGEKEREREEEREKKKEDPSLSAPSSARLSSIVTLEDLQQKRWHWHGVQMADSETQTNQSHYYGPSSSTYFMHRMRSYLKEAPQVQHLREPLQPDAVSKIFALPTRLSPNGSPSQDSNAGETSVMGKDMSRSQEEYLLNLFWLSYHFIVPILNEKDFREYYHTLWANSPSSVEPIRKPSALVDIMLALCIQYGTAFMPRDETVVDVDGDGSSIAGCWLYHRSQRLLSSEHETATISVLQCHIYSVIYLTNASFSNIAHKTLAVAIQTAHALGIHHEAPNDSPSAEHALRRRMWWTLCLQDSQAYIELGRPHLIHISEMACSLPSDDQAESIHSGSHSISTFADISWLTFHTQCVKLIITVRAIYTAFYEKCSESITLYEGKDPYDNPELLESCATHLLQSTKALQTWVRNVPKSLQIPRRGTSEPFSTVRSSIELDPYIPFWLQRQRLLLELFYHKFAMSLYRLFIRFPPGSTALYPISAGHSVLCLGHASTATYIVHQVLTETDVLNGSHETYRLQWDAALSILGFNLAHPMCPHAPSARKAFHTAIANLDIIAASNLAGAASAATLMRDLLEKMELLAHGLHDNLRPSSNTTTPTSQTLCAPPPSGPYPPQSPQQGQALQLAGQSTIFPTMQNPSNGLPGPASVASPFFKSLNTLPGAAPYIACDFPPEMFSYFDEETAQLKGQALDAARFESWMNWQPSGGEGNGLIESEHWAMDVDPRRDIDNGSF